MMEMEFETAEINGAFYVLKNGVRSILSAEQIRGDVWAIFTPAIAYTRETKADALTFIADQMGDWYTTSEAAARLVELGAFDEPPSAHDVCWWARHGLLPGSIKITGKGGWGRGGSWRIPASALLTFAEGRKK